MKIYYINYIWLASTPSLGSGAELNGEKRQRRMLRINLHDAKRYYDQEGKVTLDLRAHEPYDDKTSGRMSGRDTLIWDTHYDHVKIRIIYHYSDRYQIGKTTRYD
jgi:hypothetical protein